MSIAVKAVQDGILNVDAEVIVNAANGRGIE